MEIKRCYDTIIGASVGRNQLINPSLLLGGSNNGITVTADTTTGEITVSGTATANTSIVVSNAALEVKNGHVYYLSQPQGASTNTFWLRTGENTFWNYKQIGKSIDETVTSNLRVYVASGQTVNFKIKPQFIDLTAELGSSIADYIYNLESATAGSGTAKLREWGFLRGYQAFNSGSIESVEVTGKVVRGFNAWDEVAETGTYDLNTGTPISTSSYFRTKNPIKALPNTAYHIASGGDAVYVFFYDADDNYLGYRTFSGQSSVAFTTAINCYYMRFVDVTRNVYDPSVKPICVNISNPDRNGEYEPYTEQTYDYGTDTLNGIFKLDASNNLYADGDRKEADGTITRKYGVVDLGTLNWMYDATYADFSAPVVTGMVQPVATAIPNVINTKYTAIAYDRNTTNDKVLMIGRTGVNYIRIKDSAYTDATAFKNSLSNVMLVYELATPTTEQSTPFTSPQIVYPDGTEEFVTENGVPVGHETRYEL